MSSRESGSRALTCAQVEAERGRGSLKKRQMATHRTQDWRVCEGDRASDSEGSCSANPVAVVMRAGNRRHSWRQKRIDSEAREEQTMF